MKQVFVLKGICNAAAPAIQVIEDDNIRPIREYDIIHIAQTILTIYIYYTDGSTDTLYPWEFTIVDTLPIEENQQGIVKQFLCME